MSDQQQCTILDVLEAQLDAIESGLASARATIAMMRDQSSAAKQRPAERKPPRTFGDSACEARAAEEEGASSGDLVSRAVESLP